MANPQDVKLLEEAVRLQKEGKQLTKEQQDILKKNGIFLQKQTRHYEDQVKNIQRYIDALKRREGIETDVNELIAQQNRMQDAQVAILEAQVRAANEFINSQPDELRGAEEALRVAEERLAQQNLLLDLQKKGVRSAQETAKMEKLLAILGNKTRAELEAGAIASQATADAKKEIIKHLNDELPKQKKLRIEAERKRDLEKTVGDGQKAQQGHLKNFAKTFMGITDQSDSFTSSILDQISAQRTLNALAAEEAGIPESAGELSAVEIFLSDVLPDIKQQMRALGEDFGGSMFAKVQEATLEFMKQYDTLTASFRKNTGIIDKGLGGLESRTAGVQRANLKYGVSLDEAYASLTSLSSGMAAFSTMSEDNQDNLIRTTALLQEFGVSSQTTTEIFNDFSKGLGYSAQQLEGLSLKLMAVSKSLKVPPNIIFTEFNAASKELMKYGSNMEDVFVGLAEQSKQTGIAIGELIGIAKQFDTFEAAGESVGKLNAILGGPYLSAINMVYATEEERIKAMRQSIEMSGRTFKDLSRHEKQAIATAAGISDMSQAAKLFGGSSSEFAKTRMEMEEMQNRAQKAQSVQEKFTQVMQSFAIALGPVVHILGALADVLIFVLNPIGAIAEALGVENQGIIGQIGMATAAIYGLTFATMKFGVGFLTALGPITAGVAAFAAMYNILDGINSIAGRVAVGLIAIGAAIAIALAIPSGGGSVLAFMAAAGIAAATVASTIGAISGGVPLFSDGGMGKGGPAVVGEDGQELILGEDGQTYRVDSPSLVNLGEQDEVLSNADSKKALEGGGAGSPDLVPVLAALQKTLGQLSAVINKTENSAAGMEKDSKPVIINMDGKKVAESTIHYIKTRSNLKLSPNG